MGHSFSKYDIKHKYNYRCGLCEYYAGAKTIKKGFSRNSIDSIEVENKGYCLNQKREEAAVHSTCSRFKLCGQAQLVLAQIESEKARKESEREMKRVKELNRREQEKALARARSEASSSYIHNNNSYEDDPYYDDEPLPKLTKAELMKMEKEREEYNKEKKKSKANCWIFTVIGIASAILGFVMTFVGVNVGTDKAALFIALVIIGMVGLLCAIVFFIISIVKWRKHQNKYGR